MILNLFLSTSSGTLSVSQFGITGSQTIDFIIKIIFTVFSFAIAISSGALKIYEIQDRLEAAIRLKNDWTVFSASIASELQLPIELRHDALYIIDRNKSKYLDLLKMEIDASDGIKKKAASELPHPAGMSLDLLSLPRIMIDICISEMNDFKSDNVRNRDRFSRTVGGRTVRPALAVNALAAIMEEQNTNAEVPESIFLDIDSPIPPPPPLPPGQPPTLSARDDWPPAPPPSYSEPSPLQSPPPQG